MRRWLFLWLLLSLVSFNKSKNCQSSSSESKPICGCKSAPGSRGQDAKKCPKDPQNPSKGSSSESIELEGTEPAQPVDKCNSAPGLNRGDGRLPRKHKPKKCPEGPQKPDKCQCNLKGKKKKEYNKYVDGGPSNVKCCVEYVAETLKYSNYTSALDTVQKLEETLTETDLNETLSLSAEGLVAFIHKPKGPFEGLSIYASDKEAKSEAAVSNYKVHVQVPKELSAESNNTIAFCMVSLPQMNQTIIGSEVLLYENRLISLSVRGKRVSSLQERVNITMSLTTSINGTLEPKCVFLNFSTNSFSDDGCVTHSTHNQVICSCNHFTYFGILMVSPDITVSDQVNLSYITVIGCSISLFGLFITVLLFITKRTIRTDVSMKVHINLAIALILLNLHLLPNEAVAALPYSGLCFYMGLVLHYSLLATFIWMALEGFHLYLLLVRVFNIYIRKYILKLSLVGWGVPAVIVSIVVAIDRNIYGRTLVNPLNSNSTQMCYIDNHIVKMVTTVGLFCLVFIFNSIMLIVTVRRILSIRHSKEYGQNESSRARRDVCTLFGISVLLGTTWGLIFFSFNRLTIAGLYAFCILNSLQGFFIFLWFVMSMRKTRTSTTKTSTETRSSHG